MKPLYRGVLLAVLQIALVLSLAGKMLYDRATRPRVWVKTAPVGPDLPIRGRYVQLRLEVIEKWSPGRNKEVDLKRWWDQDVELSVENNQLTALRTDKRTGLRLLLPSPPRIAPVVLYEPVAYFIPEHIADPSRRAQGEELWVEVTVPKKGPPRPIRLGVKKDGKLTPLEIN
ncbi:MAG: GDYXXLXY domain-containing protein [Acidobacteria bacterium]|nr:GDYXXLXY domain-containing protein [Acidobacteriota bacterium]